MRRAVIDIGTNSVKLLVAEVTGESVQPVWEESEQTRLGKGFYEHHRLQKSAIDHTAQVVSRFAAKAREQRAESIRVIATSATRDAANQDQLLEAVRQAADVNIEVITGEE